MFYFDNAATSFPKAPGVSQAMVDFLARDAANPGRSGHRMAVATEQMLDSVRHRLAKLFDGDDANRMIFALNGTDALNMAIHGVLPAEHPRGGKPQVITTVLEHNSVSRPLQAMAQAGRIELVRVDCDDQGFVDPNDIRKAIGPRTMLIIMTHASNVLGTIQDAAAVGKIAREHDVLFCLDAAQTAGIVPISIEKMHLDMLAFPGHKSLLGPTGTGGLYVGPRCPGLGGPGVPGGPDGKTTGPFKHPLATWREGGTGGDSSTPTQPTVFPYYLEGGTPNTVGLVGLGAGLDYLESHPMAQALDREQAMVKTIIEKLGSDERFIVYGSTDASRRVGTVSINIQGIEPSDVGSMLDAEFQIAVRPGLHCAPYIHKRIGTFPSGAVRISPGPFNTDEELSLLLDALHQIAG